MPTIYFTDDRLKTSGIDITFRKKDKVLRIGGWYDNCVGIESREITLAEFCKRLGITAKMLLEE